MLRVWAPVGVGEIRVGDDLVDVLLTALDETGLPLHDGDIVLVTSKVVSKAEGRSRESTRDEALPGETARVVATRGATRIVRNRLGLTMAAAGIDASNVEAGRILLLPVDPDASAARLRAGVLERTGTNVGVIVTDTAGRAWREGQTDIAIGAAGLTVLESFAGQVDGYGNPLVVTVPAVADELAGAAELAQGKLRARPFAVVSGREDLVLPAGEDGPGATALIRPEGADLFGYGAREAVLQAIAAMYDEHSEARVVFGAPASIEELLAALAEVGYEAQAVGEDVVVRPETDVARLLILAVAFGWHLTRSDDAGARLSPRTP
ncbi:coenzyme F420-0:L-glutamate ligase [Nocardioides sp. Kera G14]|uniref:coenzyme F420-0:L-glutamate ligase n=1 Tax=Nocardioides sp. Kera G14 TaxID=2884264 RepID=UPI001D117DCC|nr:coenzyme F420-0:L-glutamate ligase [Nocardioides sp. Kera G14]UDY22750.1 coenzyme F420-0:L-glutamate ligase [Nocardioides sp. Kera G14]